MLQENKKTVKIIGFVLLAGILIGGAIGLYMFNMPHRNVQSADIDYSISTSHLITEYLANAELANNKYLVDDGNSKIIGISGTVAEISENFDGQKVVLLKETNDNAGVSCTFLIEASINAEKLKVGEITTIKGVIRSGAGYDEDLELYENVILEECDIVNQ